MKKTLSFLIIAALILCTMIPVAAAEETVEGVVKDFSGNSITIAADGKILTYSIDSNTKILLNGMPSILSNAAYKGVKVQFKASGQKAAELNFSEIGDQHQGYMTMAVIYPREMITDTNTDLYYSPAISTASKTETGVEDESIYTVRDSKTIDLGSIDLVKDSLKVVLNGKELKLIYDEAVQFDKSADNDEVKISYDTESENELLLNFEKEISGKTEDIEKILKINYKKKMYKISVKELYNFILDENVHVELNGVETSVPKAMNRSTYAYYILNPEGRIIYINSFYQDLECVIDSINGNKISISVNISDRTPFKDTVELSPSVSINGGALSVNDLKVKDAIKLTIDPYDAYRVTSIVK